MSILIFLLYILWASFLCLKLKDIKATPQKYDNIPGYVKYRQSKWYQQKNKRGCYEFTNSTGLIRSSVYVALIPLFLFVFIFLPQWFSLGRHPRDGSVFRFVSPPFSGQLISGVILIGCFFVLVHYLFLFSSRPFAIAVSLEQNIPRFRRSVTWRNMTILALAAAIIACPFHIWMILGTGYADSEKIVYRPFFSFQEVTIEYEDIEEIEIVYTDGVESHCFLSAGEHKIDISGILEITDFLPPYHKLETFVFPFLSPELLQNAKIVS